ncbi:MAG TPA: LysR family transcriptional regulator [Acidobacteriaceae bacterium]|jgi:DNA-binding transcriptional LysR family regulator|nr:LysR family transcriptional regulator [Acidobacteriaceae bacterium]
MVNLNELQFFIQVSQAQSFTRAAKRLGVPKSSVSRAILRLENRLGVRLVERTTRRVALTEIGELYLHRCKRVVEEAEQADLAIGALQATPQGTLRVGAPVAFARSILGPTLGEFLAMYPEVRLRLQLLNGNEATPEGAFDVVVRAGVLEDSGLLVKPLMRIRLGAYASPRYLQNRKLPDTPADLLQLSCITTSCDTHGETGDFTTWRLRSGVELKEIRVDARVSVPDPTINHQLALAGAGVALLAQSVVQEDIEHGRLIRILPNWEPEPVELHALYPSRLDSSPKVRAFLQFLRERFGTGSSSGGRAVT